jgi:hypothetical protein
MTKSLLPNNINYKKYHSTSGLATRVWGPFGWGFLFSCIMGYPVHIKTASDKKTKRAFKELFKNLSFILPCKFCKESFAKFYKQLPIDKYLVGRLELMYWLYLIKDKVITKLISQERDCYNKEKRELKKKFYNKEISKENYYSRVNQFREYTLITKPSPPFEDILNNFEQFRATCSKKAKTCSVEIKYQ